MPEETIVAVKNIDLAVAQASLELLRIAEFYKRHNKIQQAAEVERAIARFDSKIQMRPGSKNRAA